MIAACLKAAAVSLALAATAPCFAVAQDLSQPEKDFEAFWALYDESYALFEVKHVDWDALYRIYRPMVTPQTDREALFEIFTEMTGLLNDVHVTVEDDRTGRFSRSGGRSLGVGPFDMGEFSLELVETAYVEGSLERRANDALAFGWLPGEIGYLRVASFKYPDTSASTMDRAIEQFSHARGMVVDVRQNSGGSDRIAEDIASRFARTARSYMTVSERLPAGSSTGVFNAPVVWHIPAKGVGWGERPVIVLTNSRTISAAENFVIAMKTLPHAIIIGDTTAGVMADAHRMPAGDGWRFGVPMNVMRDSNGVSWEGVGLVPDYWVRNSPDEIQAGRDRVLEFAIGMIGAGPRVGSRSRIAKN